ncbi:MAG TPA: protease pro-enzyme activation domain-containing protein, partial [Terriglobales bacterium]
MNQRQSFSSTFKLPLLALTAASLFMGSAWAQNNYKVPNNTPGFIQKAVDQGAVDPSTVISVTVWLKLHNEQQLDQLVQKQYQKGSANYHQWLNQGQFNANFSPTSQEVNSVQNFLTAHNLTVVTVAENNFYIKVQGAISDIEKAFHVQIDSYNLNGASYRSNTGDPSVNDASGGLISAITGMDDYGFQPAIVRPTEADGTPIAPIAISSPQGTFFEGQCFRGVETHTFKSASAKATYTGNRFGADISNTTLGHLAPCG